MATAKQSFYEKKAKRILLKAESIDDVWLAYNLLNNKQKESVFEYLTFFGMRSHHIYHEVYTTYPLTVPFSLQQEYELDLILKGSSTMGADLFTMPVNTQRLTAVECKSVHSEGKSLKLEKFGVKDLALNKTKITKEDRILVHNFDSVSQVIDKIADHWTHIHIDTLINEDTLPAIQSFIKTDKVEMPAPFDYRADLLEENYHKKQIHRVVDKMLSQHRKHGRSMGLIIKPTATGKGVDPLIIFKKHLLPIWKPTKKRPYSINTHVSPSLTVMTGNVLKQVKDTIGSGLKKDVRLVVWASDLTPGDDINDIKMLNTWVDVVHTDKQLQDIVNHTDKHIVIHTTIHSYWRVEEALVANGTKDIYFRYIDEVKHTVQEWTSRWTRCLKHDRLNVAHTLGADANIVTGDDGNGDPYESSMTNTKVWPEIYEEMSEAKAVELGWKRKTEIEVYRWADDYLPPELQHLIRKGKQGFVSVKGYSSPIPFTWVVSIHSLVQFKLNNPERHHTMVSTNKIVWANQYEQVARILFPQILKAMNKDGRNPLIKRLLKTHIKSIYQLGKSSRAINRAVDSIPDKYEDSIIIQVKLLSEGWDPKKAWLDSWSFADPSASKIRIYQIGGRPARIESLYNPKLKSSKFIHSEIISTQDDVEIAINRSFKSIAQVAEAMEIGEDTIEDSITFFDWQNVPHHGGGVRTKGNKNLKALLELDPQAMLNGFQGYYSSGRRFNPYSNFVNEVLFPETQKFYDQCKRISNKDMSDHTDSILADGRFDDFLSQYSNKRTAVSKIRQGGHHLLTDENRLIGKTNWANFKRGAYAQYEDDFRAIIDALKQVTQEVSIEHIVADRIAYAPLVGSVLGKTQRHERNAIGKILKHGHGSLSRKNPKLNNQLKAEVKQTLDDYANKIKQINQDILDFQMNMISEFFNPTSSSSQGEINKAVKEKWQHLEKGCAGVIDMNGVSRKILYPHKKKLAQMYEDNKKTAEKLYLAKFKQIDKYQQKGIAQVDQEVEQELAKQYGLKHNVEIVESVRKKAKSLKPLCKWASDNRASLVVQNRKPYKIWNKGTKGVQPSPYANKTEAEKKKIFNRLAKLRKQSMKERFPNGYHYETINGQRQMVAN